MKPKKKKCFLRKQKVVLVLIVAVESTGGGECLGSAEMCKARMEPPPRLNKFRYPFALSPNSRINQDERRLRLRSERGPVIGRAAVLQIDREEKDFSEVFFWCPFHFHMGQ